MVADGQEFLRANVFTATSLRRPECDIAVVTTLLKHQIERSYMLKKSGCDSGEVSNCWRRLLHDSLARSTFYGGRMLLSHRVHIQNITTAYKKQKLTFPKVGGGGEDKSAFQQLTKFSGNREPKRHSVPFFILKSSSVIIKKRSEQRLN